MTKRGDRVVPPVPRRGWTIRFLDNAVALGWRELCNVAASATYAAWETLTFHPTESINPARHRRLHRELATFDVQGKTLEQWQYKVTDGGRVWFCPDPGKRTVWLTYASPKHPKATE